PRLTGGGWLRTRAGGPRKAPARAATGHRVQPPDGLLGAPRHDVNAMQSWRTTVQNGQIEFDKRYQREYLDSEKYRGFDEALVRLLNLLELPGVGKILSGTLWLVRTPYRMVKAALGKVLRRPDAPTLAEMPVLQESLHGW